jgi:hypothetical protein
VKRGTRRTSLARSGIAPRRATSSPTM